MGFIKSRKAYCFFKLGLIDMAKLFLVFFIPVLAMVWLLEGHTIWRQHSEIDAVYFGKSGSPVVVDREYSINDCQQYAENYLRGLDGYVHCVAKDGAVAWSSSSKN